MSTRERILKAASQLFYRKGFQAVGVDTIVEESGVAKMTLYRHFPSKDDLIVAYLEQSNEYFWAWMEQAAAKAEEPKDKIIAVFEALGKLATSPSCLGCTFQSSAAEFPERTHPAHKIALDHKKRVLQYFTDLAEKAQLRDPDILANQLLLLMDGAWVAARMFDSKNAAMYVADAARALCTDEVSSKR